MGEHMTRERMQDAITDFEVATRVGREVFKLLEEHPDGAAGRDPETLADAGIELTRAAEQLLTAARQGTP